MRFTTILPLLALAGPVLAAQLPANEPYIESGGFVAGEAENYHAKTSAVSDDWTEVASNAVGAIANSRGAGYMQSLPDGDGTIKTYATGARIDYKILIQTPGLYRLWVRWDGVNDSSDSLFAGMVELADGTGGAVADWYELTRPARTNFLMAGWDGLGGPEENLPGASDSTMTWTFPSSAVYTLRFVVREDGSAIDTWVLQFASRPAPTGAGFAVVQPDTMTMHHLGQAGIPVLRNDTGLLDPASVNIGDPPTHGSAAPSPDGRIVYRHTNGIPASDTFTYRVQDILGLTSSPAAVTVNFSTNPRIPNTTVAVPREAPPTAYQITEAFPGVVFPRPPTTMESPPGDTNRLFVAVRPGQIYVIPNVSAASPTNLLFMDLSSRVYNDGNEQGLKGIAFHPGYATNGQFYVTYVHQAGNGTRYVRLSRFLRQPGNPNAGDLNSELILINQVNDDTVHNIADAQFGPDGYLYVGFGDEGPQNDGNNNSQRIDKDLWSGIVRIDPDKRPGNPEPNKHAGIPTNASGLAYFSVPADNPFIGATQFNNLAVNPASVRTEFYAVGFRNPWQFTFDPLTHDLWAGDVGGDAREEVDLVKPGRNYGWAYFEGVGAGPKTPPGGFTYERPVWDYPHGSGEFQGYCIIAGLVYRGDKYPSLYGKFLGIDYVSGNLWTIERTPGATNVTRIAGEGGVVQIALNPANGDILLLDLGDTRIRKLVASTSDLAFPQTLTDTGFFADLADLAPNPGVVPYAPNLAFWSDHAIKRRWFVITNTADRMSYARESPWTFPAGMMWAKHFDLDLDRGNPATRTRIETRILVRTTNGAYGVSYRWNTNGTEAFLAPDAGVNFNLNVTNQGVALSQPWRIPSRAECLACHTPAGGHALSFNTRQLNGPGAIAGQTGNFLRVLDTADYLTAPPDAPETLPRHVRPDETEYSLEARARSYFAVNCGYCHMGAQSIVPGTWDGRAATKLADAGLVRATASSNGGNTNNLLVVPGDTLHSIVWNRMAATNGFTRMPPLGTYELDQTNIQMIAAWINGELAAWQSYAMWRATEFASSNSPEGAPEFDADGDARSNYEEFLTRTDPNDEADFWTGGIDWSPEYGVSVGHDLHNRAVTIETATNLDGAAWTRWNVPGNTALPIASGAVLRISTPDTNTTEYFRFRVEEL